MFVNKETTYLLTYLLTYLQTQFSEDRCTQFRVIAVTDPPTHKQTGPITIHCVAASARCNKKVKVAHLL